MKHLSFRSCLVSILLTVIAGNIAAQEKDTLCYKEIFRCSAPNVSLSHNVVPSYIHNWLFFLKKNKSGQNIELSIYKAKDTLSITLSPNLHYSTIATNQYGNPVLIVHPHSLRVGISKIVFFDSILRVTRIVPVKKSTVIHKEGVFYANIRYVRENIAELILQNSVYAMGDTYSLSLETATLSQKLNDVYTQIYDYGIDSVHNKERNHKTIFWHENRKYDYTKPESIIEGTEIYTMRGKMSGNISSNYLQDNTLFIEGGFVTQFKNGDVVFYKFCETVEDD